MNISVDEIVIRPAREFDLSGLEWDGQYARYRRVFHHAFLDTLSGKRIMLVADAGQLVAGQIFAQLSSADSRFADGIGRGYLYALRVRPEWQGRGLGTRLILAAERELSARGFTFAVISAGKDNPRALQLYQRLGYRIFAEDPGVWYFVDVNGQPQSVEEPCWVLEKSLGGHLAVKE
jgi:ribosomal protein S18 acetylase RimI-like enzyme